MLKSEIISIASKYNLRIHEESIEINQSGLDFFVAYATDINNTEWVLRFPRRSDVNESAISESKVLGLVLDKLPIKVPQWKINNSELIAYPKLNGEPAGTIDPIEHKYIWKINPENLSDNFVNSFAKFLVALHKIDLKLVTDKALKFDTLEQVKQNIKDNIVTAKNILYIPDKVLNSWDEWLSAENYWTKNFALTHGDLHAGHMLIDSQENLTGILDWTEAKVTDPAIDFTGYFATFGQNELKRLLESYKINGGFVWERMEEHIIKNWNIAPIYFVAFALKSGNNSHLGVAQSLIDSQ